VMKNIVLAGVGQVTLMDERKVADAEPGNFLIPCDADASATYVSAPRPLTPIPSHCVVPCGLPNRLAASTLRAHTSRCWCCRGGGRAAAASCNTLKEMNPMVTINTTSGPVDELTDAALADFHVVLMGGGSLRDQAALNARCRKLGT
jgi:molybdopterin/thiamine biosynthesis adenylyltransferase